MRGLSKSAVRGEDSDNSDKPDRVLYATRGSGEIVVAEVRVGLDIYVAAYTINSTKAWHECG
jgi:hypothetical protein